MAFKKLNNFIGLSIFFVGISVSFLGCIYSTTLPEGSGEDTSGGGRATDGSGVQTGVPTSNLLTFLPNESTQLVNSGRLKAVVTMNPMGIQGIQDVGRKSFSDPNLERSAKTLMDSLPEGAP